MCLLHESKKSVGLRWPRRNGNGYIEKELEHEPDLQKLS